MLIIECIRKYSRKGTTKSIAALRGKSEYSKAARGNDICS